MKRGPGRPPKLDRLAVVRRHGVGVAFDEYELAAIERYRDEQQRQTGVRPSRSSFLRALVREWAGLSDDGPTVVIRVHEQQHDTQPPSPAP